MATKQQIRDQIFDIEDRIKPLFPKILIISFVLAVFSLGVIGLVSLIIEVLGWT